MTKEEKELVLKDLAGRLPYGFLYCYTNEHLAKGKPIILTPVVVSNIMNATDNLVVKPYLRPMSSMTEEEKEEYINTIEDDSLKSMLDETVLLIDWLNSKHFDYRGLIEKGLAIEAPKGLYTTEKEE